MIASHDCGNCKHAQPHMASTNPFPVDTRAAKFRMDRNRVICTEDPMVPVVLYDSQSPCDRFRLRDNND